jgi:hypothetical protein
MTDEKYTFVQDVREKKVTGYSASKRRTHGGKRGRVRLPSDNLTKKELLRMSGECKSYRLNEPMKWFEFRQMPDDLKITYIKLLREKFNVPDTYLAKMFGVDQKALSTCMAKLNYAAGKRSGRTKWDKDGFLAWCNGAPIPAKEEIPVEEPEMSEEEAEEVLNYLGIAPVIEEEPEEEPAKVVPNYANMGFEGEAEEVLKTVMGILGKARVRITIGWTVLEDK